MNAVELHVSERAAELRRSFDRSFAELQNSVAVATDDFLAIHAGGDPYMLRLSEVAGLHVDRKVTPMPSRIVELRGLAGFRGSMLPVYDLAALLAYPSAEAPRWIVIAAEAPVALAFDSFDGHFRSPREAVASRTGASPQDHVHQILRVGDGVRSIIHLPSIIAAVRTRVPAVSQKEH
jgi:purine-binding chemotaxis protein CheW